MKKHIVCLGDSNTYGYYASSTYIKEPRIQRYDESERWPCLLQDFLGSEYLVLEEGLCGRTFVFSDPLREGLSALEYIYPCLKSHEPVALLIIMLGTNDTKERFGANATCIAAGMERLVKKAMVTDCWKDVTHPNILIIAPPALGKGLKDSDYFENMGKGCIEKSAGVAKSLCESAARLGVHFLDAEKLGCKFNQIDYMHLTKESHALLAKELASYIRGIT